MHILIITPHYIPDLGPSAPLFTMLSTRLVQRGHQVTVIAAVPHYPSGRVSPAFRGKAISRSIENGVEVVRVPIPSLDRTNLAQRMVQLSAFQIGATWASLNQKCDVVLVSNPALEAWMPFTWQAVVRKKPTIFSIHDVYPDVGIKLGIFKKQWQIAAVARLEKFCLDHSLKVRILSDSFRPGVHNLGVPDSKISLIYDWVDTDLIHPLPKENQFAEEFGLANRFVVLYAGNIGFSQGLEHILATAKLLSDHDDIQFTFVGDGSGKRSLQTEAETLGLKNVQFIPFQPRERLPEVLASADISLVILKRGIGTDSLPSKTFSILASGRPLIASVDEGSETWKLIERAQAGICIPPEDPEKLAKTILKVKNDPDLRRYLSENGRQWAEDHHSAASAAEQFEALFDQIFTSKSA